MLVQPDEDAGSTGELYSHTSHQIGTTHMEQPDTGAGSTGGGLYSHIGATHTGQPQTSAEAEYDILNLPQYDDPQTLQASVPNVDIGARYELAEIEPTTNSTPSAAIYNELEEHTYSALVNN